MSHCYERIQSIMPADDALMESQADCGNGCLQVAAIPQLMMPCSDMYICTGHPCGRMVTVTGCCYATCELLNHLIHVHVQL